MRFKDTLIPFVAEGLPGFERSAPDALSWTSDTMPAAYRIVRILYRYIDPD
jgi:hypothetical protein